MNFTKKKIVSGLLLAMSFAAIASPEIPKSMSVSGTEEVNGNTKGLQKVKGFGNDMPLVESLKQIVPSGWTVVTPKSSSVKPDMQGLVSWSGNKTWPEILSDLMVSSNNTANIDWKKKKVFISKLKVDVLTISANNDLKELKPIDNKLSSSTVFDMADATGYVKSPVLVPAPAPSKEWVRVKTKTLQENVAAWAALAGYDLVWQGRDYKTPKLSSYGTGAFEDLENGPIAQLSIEYGVTSNVETPLTFEIYNENVLVVSNVVFEQGNVNAGISDPTVGSETK